MSVRTITRRPGPNNPEGCPFCGAHLTGRVEVKHATTTVVVVSCPNEGDLVLASDLVAALPTLSDAQRTATRDYLRALRGATDAPEELDLTKVRTLAG